MVDSGSLATWVGLGVVLLTNAGIIIASVSKMQVTQKALDRRISSICKQLEERNQDRLTLLEKLIHMEAELTYIKKELDLISQQNKVVRSALITKALNDHSSHHPELKEVQA